MKQTTTSELTLITGIGRVPLTRTQVATWRQHLVVPASTQPSYGCR